MNDAGVLALAGGVGGARLAHGLAMVLPPEALTVVVNTGDDFEHLGLHVAPDLDTVMYTLAGRADPERGWGVAGESWRCMDALARLDGPTWFQLGDQDLATHLRRTQLLRQGATLSQATAQLCAQLGVRQRVVPMSDSAVRTQVRTSEGVLAFQDYFVRRRCEPRIEGVEFAGSESALPSAAFVAAWEHPGLRMVIVCPSNPFVSIAPILALPGVRERLRQRRIPVVAVSPIVGGQAIKGPAAKMMRELGMQPSALAVARGYAGLVDGFVLDGVDAALWSEVAALGLQPLVTETVMRTEGLRAQLARELVDFGEGLSARGGTG